MGLINVHFTIPITLLSIIINNVDIDKILISNKVSFVNENL